MFHFFQSRGRNGAGLSKTESTGLTPSTSSRDEEPEAPMFDRRVISSTSYILLCVSVIVVPLTFLSVVLLGLVYHYRVRHTSSLSLSSPIFAAEPDEKGVIYVKFPASLLMVVVSVDGSVATYLAAWFAALLSFTVARRMRKYSMAARTRSLPSPHQLALLCMALYGLPESIWEWLQFKYRGKKTTTGMVRFTLWGLSGAYALGYISESFSDLGV